MGGRLGAVGRNDDERAELTTTRGTVHLVAGRFTSLPARMRVPAFIRNHKLATALIVVILAPIVIMTIWTTASLGYSYSSGERAGYLQKISKRGWLCKTWEGEIQLLANPGTAPERFAFSIRSDSIATMLNRLNGQKVVVTYDQHKGVPGSCFGDTEYYVTAVRAVSGP
jgi:hypothetical protein